MNQSNQSPNKKNSTNQFTIRVGNIPYNIGDDQILFEFQKYGHIEDYKRPMNLSKKRPTSYAFIQYNNLDSVELAISEMNFVYIWGAKLSVTDGSKQESFFTQDTGFITNEAFDVPKAPEAEFDSSLPYNHYTVKRRNELKHADKVYSIRIDDLHQSIDKELLEEIFSKFGEISNIYLPVDLNHGCKPKGFAFIRYLNQNDALRALQVMDGANLGIGRDIKVTFTTHKTYFNQDETPNVF